MRCVAGPRPRRCGPVRRDAVTDSSVPLDALSLNQMPTMELGSSSGDVRRHQHAVREQHVRRVEREGAPRSRSACPSRSRSCRRSARTPVAPPPRAPRRCRSPTSPSRRTLLRARPRSPRPLHKGSPATQRGRSHLLLGHGTLPLSSGERRRVPGAKSLTGCPSFSSIRACRPPTSTSRSTCRCPRSTRRRRARSRSRCSARRSTTIA